MATMVKTHNRERICKGAIAILALVVFSQMVSVGLAAIPGPAAAKAKKQKAEAKPEETVTKPATTTPAEHFRDPFSVPKPVAEEPVVNQSAEEFSGPAPAGKKGLIISQLKLEGIVRVGSKMLAVLANPANRAYFLYENDELRNGAVSKITPDAVYFREDYKDPTTGKIESREVVQRLVPAPGEKK